MKRFKNDILVDNWGMIRKMTEKEKAREKLLIETKKATEGKKRILDPFKGWIEVK